MFRRRLKDNFSVIREEDRSRLLEAKDEVEKEMTEKKWMLIAEKVKQSGGDEYSVSLSVQLKNLACLTDTAPGRSSSAPVQEAHAQGRSPSAAGHRGS